MRGPQRPMHMQRPSTAADQRRAPLGRYSTISQGHTELRIEQGCVIRYTQLLGGPQPGSHLTLTFKPGDVKSGSDKTSMGMFAIFIK
jgi:hypothetical protein